MTADKIRGYEYEVLHLAMMGGIYQAEVGWTKTSGFLWWRATYSGVMYLLSQDGIRWYRVSDGAEVIAELSFFVNRRHKLNELLRAAQEPVSK